MLGDLEREVALESVGASFSSARWPIRWKVSPTRFTAAIATRSAGSGWFPGVAAVYSDLPTSTTCRTTPTVSIADLQHMVGVDELTIRSVLLAKKD